MNTDQHRSPSWTIRQIEPENAFVPRYHLLDELGSDTEIDNELSIAAHGRLGFQEVERLVCFLKRLS